MILAILQARMSSNRLPGKVLKPLLGKPMVERQLERIKRSRLIDKIVLATSNETSDDPIAAFCQTISQPCFRGDLNHVLSRFYHCAEQYQPTHVVRLTADCPVTDPHVIDEVIELHLSKGFDYTTNAIPRTYPDGLDVEIFTMDALRQSFENASTAMQREHVTVYIRQHSETFKLGELSCPQDLSQQRWTVDNQEDFVLVEQIYQTLYPVKPDFGYQDVLALYRQSPQMFAVNQHLVESA